MGQTLHLIVIIKHLLLKGVEGLVQLEPGVACGEGGDKCIGLDPFGGVVIYTGVDSFQNVIRA